MTTKRPQRPPAEGPETREETIKRVAPGGAAAPDPSMRQRLGTRIVRVGHGSALLAGLVTFVCVLALGGGVPFALALGGGIAIAGGVFISLLLVEREDGRIERMVEHRGGRGTDERSS